MQSTLDRSGRGLYSLERVIDSQQCRDVETVNYDKNFIKRIENLHQYGNLQRLSIARNQLVDMGGIASLSNLTYLNLSQNNISSIQGLRNLSKLTVCNLAGNKIRVIENLNYNVNLEHLDLSDNSLMCLGDLRSLSRLKVLLLHGNKVSSLKSAPSTLPPSVTILSLASNAISDLNEVSHLFHFKNLEQLSIMNNPCVSSLSPDIILDYRPFVVNWCVNLRLLDGATITDKEALKAEWLYSQGKGRHFKPGQHRQLLQYICSACSLTASSDFDRNEDVKLSRVLMHQRLYQQQQDSEPKCNLPVNQRSTTAHPINDPHRNLMLNSDQMKFEDIIIMDDSNNCMLESESRYLPLPSDDFLSSSPSDDQPTTSPSYATHSEKTFDIPVSAVNLTKHEKITERLVRDVSSPGRPNTQKLGTISKFESVDSSTLTVNNKSQLYRAASIDFNSISSLSPGAASVLRHASPSLSTQFNVPITSSSILHPSGFTSNAQSHPIHSVQASTGSPSTTNGVYGSPVMQAYPHMLLRGQSGSTLATRATQCEDSDTDNGSSCGVVLDTSLKQIKGKLRKSSLNAQGTRRDGLIPTTVPRSSTVVAAGMAALQQQYNPDKYANPQSQQVYQQFSQRRRSRETEMANSPSQSVAVLARQSRLKLGQSKDVSMAVDSNISPPSTDIVRTLAAIKLQAFWRGCVARHKNPTALKVCAEMRIRRSEEHIRHLEHQLIRQSQLYDNEKQLRLYHEEAMKQLSKEVHMLQEWKSQLEASQSVSLSTFGPSLQQPQPVLRTSSSPSFMQEFTSALTPRKASVSAAPQNLINAIERVCDIDPTKISSHQLTPPKSSTASPKQTVSFYPGLSNVPPMLALTPPMSSHKDLPELENICKKLQKEVTVLKAALLASVSTVSVDGSTVLASSDMTDECTSIAVDDGAVGHEVGSGHYKLHSGLVVLAPTDVRAVQVTSTSVLLRWQLAATAAASNSKLKNKLILGYRVYVDNEPRGMVGGGALSRGAGAAVNTALITALIPNRSYRVHLRTVSTLAESCDSNVVEFTTSQEDPAFTETSFVGELSLAETNIDSPNDTMVKEIEKDASSPLSTMDKSRQPDMSKKVATDTHNSAVVIDINRRLSDHNLRSSNAPHSLVANKLLQGIVILDNKPDGCSMIASSPHKLSDAPREFFPTSSSPRDTATAAHDGMDSQGTGGSDGGSDVKLVDEEGKFIPKPPVESFSQRRDSLPRRNSLRRRRFSNEAPNEADANPKSGSSATTPDNSFPSSEVQDPSTRSRQHHSSHGDESKPERRSASLGARAPNVYADKMVGGDSGRPPAVRRDSSVEGAGSVERPTRTSAEGPSARRNVPQSGGVQAHWFCSMREKKDGGREVVAPSSQPVVAKPVKNSVQSSAMFVQRDRSRPLFISHKRSSSDLPLNASPSETDKSFGSPGAPLQAPKSPTIRRSSSFSKATSAARVGDETSQLRECISLETLRVIKKSTGAGCKTEDSSNDKLSKEKDIYCDTSKTEASKTTDFQKAAVPISTAATPIQPAASAMAAVTKTKSNTITEADVSSCREEQTLELHPVHAWEERCIDGDSIPVRGASRPQLSSPYSPRMSIAKKSDATVLGNSVAGGGTTKVGGSKAASVFAQIQKKLSGNVKM